MFKSFNTSNKNKFHFSIICTYKLIHRQIEAMAESASRNTAKKPIKIDISSDTVCPWCFVGKKNLDKAMAMSKNQYDFEVKTLTFLVIL